MWTLIKHKEKKLGGNYTRILRVVLKNSWRQHPTKHQLYGHLPPITKTIQIRRSRHARHCWRSKGDIINDELHWTPSQGREKVGRPARTYLQWLYTDTGAMDNRDGWREKVSEICASCATLLLLLLLLLLIIWNRTAVCGLFRVLDK